MTTLEKKIDLALRWIISGSNKEAFEIEKEIKDILQEVPEKPSVVSSEDIINNFLLELGIPPHIKGFRYIAYGIQLGMNDRDYIESIHKMLYPDIAKQFDTTLTRVERAIRHAIEKASDNGLTMHHERLFGNNVSAHKGKPTNTAFIATCALEVERRMKGVRG